MDSTPDDAIIPEANQLSTLDSASSSKPTSLPCIHINGRGLFSKLAYFGVTVALVFLFLENLGIAKSIGAIATGGVAFLQWMFSHALGLFLSATGGFVLVYPIAVFVTLSSLLNWLNGFTKADHVEVAEDGLLVGWGGRSFFKIRWDEMNSVFLFCPHHTMLPRKWQVGVGTMGQRPVQIKLPVFEGKGQPVLEMIKRQAPWLSVDPALIELWEPVIADSHTELWLKSLSAAPKGDELLPLFPGAKLKSGAYVITRRLAIGGQGTAYLATRCSIPADADGAESARAQLVVADPGNANTEIVVVKETLFPVYVAPKIREEAERRFNNESQLLDKLRHPQIVTLHDSFIEGHRGYLVLEYIEGESLRSKIKNEGPLSQDLVMQLALQMCAILEFLHGLEPAVIHRDFTPDNLILDKTGQLKLIDFNVAREAEATRTATVVGKHAYIPPEQFRGDTCTQSDLYAVGATLFYLLTGEEPEPISESRPSEAGVNLHAELDELVWKCTQCEVDARYQTASQIREALERISSSVVR